MYIDAEWMQKGVNALNDTFSVDDDTKREMIQFLFDEGFWDVKKLTWGAAVTRFNECLNPGRPQFFKIAELWALMKRFGRHQLLRAMAADLGYEPLRRQPTEARRQELLERIADAEEELLAIVKGARAELARMDAAPKPIRMHPAIQDGEGSFSAGERVTF